MSELSLPTSSGPKNYVTATEVNFKPKDGTYSYWDKDTKQRVTVKSVSGVVVYSAFQFMADRVVTKSRSEGYVSDPFTWNETKPGSKGIKLKKRTRTAEDGVKYANEGEFSFQELSKDPTLAARLKVSKFRMFNVVYVYDAANDELKKILFSPVVGRIVGKAIKPDQPNFLTTFAVSNEIAIRDENGDYYAPVISRSGAAPLDMVPRIAGKIQEIHGIITGKASEFVANEEPAMSNTEVAPVAQSQSIDDIPFGV